MITIDGNNSFPPEGYSSSAAALEDKLVTDLKTADPTMKDDTKLNYWVLVGTEKKANGKLVNKFTEAPQIPSEGLVYAVEHGITNNRNDYPPTYFDALFGITTNWYLDVCLPPPPFGQAELTNPFRVPLFWTEAKPYSTFKGDAPSPNLGIAMEAEAIPRIALALRSQPGSNFQGSASDVALEKLATGALNWLLGLNYGVRGRFSEPGSDVQFVSRSLVANLGSAPTHHYYIGIHQWTQATTLNGLGGTPPTKVGNGNNATYLGPRIAPWDFNVFEVATSESFLKSDGMVLMAAEGLGQMLHPFRVLEAESYTCYGGSDNDGVQTESNNVYAPH